MENSKLYGTNSPSHLPPENLYAGQEAAVITRYGTMDWFKTGKGVRQAIGIGILRDRPVPQGWKTWNHPEGRDLSHVREPHELHSLQALS